MSVYTNPSPSPDPDPNPKQETFFEAGGDQFDNCNAVCMHSGVMRQSLIDVTPFMPVSDFICEYCSQVRWLYLLRRCLLWLY